MANTQFFNNDIEMADFRILVKLWDREDGDSDYFLDISSLATSDIKIVKERNTPDTLEVTIEYTQFKEKLNYEGSSPENILMPFITEVKIQRNFETIFAGTLFHMSLALGEVGKELLTLQCCSWGQHYEKRYVGESFYGSYPDIAQKLVLAGQHELNWFDNYAWEYTDDYFEGWEWSGGEKPARASEKHWDGGIHLGGGESAWTYSMQPNNMMGNRGTLKPLHWSFWYKAGSATTLKVGGHADNNNVIGSELFSHTVNLPAAANWTKFTTTIPSKTISSNIHWLKLTVGSNGMDISDLALYTEPEQGDAYDLDIHIGFVNNNDHKWDKYRIRHYHRQNIKDALYNIAKLSSSMGTNLTTGAEEPDTFEYEFDENKQFNIYYQQGALVADPAFAAEYPGIIKSLTLERGLEDICNLSYASAEEQKSYKDKDGNEQFYVKKWASAYSSAGSMDRFGAQVDFKSFEGVQSYDDLDLVAGSDLQIFDEVQNIPEIEVDSNIYNMGNVHLGDAVIVNVLTDEIFKFVNGTYRIYSLACSISKDSVESVKITLVSPTAAALQLISFPKQYKYLRNDIKRLMTG